MVGYYLSSSDHGRQLFRRKVDTVLAAIRSNGLGKTVKCRGYDDVDGDYELLLGDGALPEVERLAADQGLRVYRITNPGLK